MTRVPSVAPEETTPPSLVARYAVVATGYDALPSVPEWPGREDFAGELIHAAEFRAAAPYGGRDVLIVGAGNSGIDIAGHLLDAGARVINFFLPGKTDVRHGDYHVILRKR